ncbi:MAG: LysE family transporter [Phormidesmis sp.]
MLIFVLIKGILMGLAIAAPVGPIALLCIRRTLAQGRGVGLASGFGAATADGLYGMVAAFGLSTFSTLLTDNTAYLQLAGGLFLCYLGLTTFWAQPAATQTLASPPPGATSSLPMLSAYTSTLALTLTNPTTIFSFIAIFAGLGITQASRLSSVTLVFGVFTGSMLWWLVLISGVTHLRNRLTPQRLTRFNQGASKVFGMLIFGFGIAALMVWQNTR